MFSDGNIGTGIELNLPDAITTDAASSFNLVIDPVLNAVIAVDERNGNREGLSSADVGNGVVFNGPFNIQPVTAYRLLIQPSDP